MKIGLIGAGHLGKIHLKCIKMIEEYELVGFYDTNPENVALVEKEFGIKHFTSIDELIQSVDVVDIVTPTIAHFEPALKAIENGKHVFIEKPVTQTLEEAEILVAKAAEKNVKVQVGHVERFNPAFTAARESLHDPVFIEAHRLAQFNPRGTDVPVVLDLMIHDIDTVLTTIKSEVKSISAVGVSIISDTPDIANARVEFENGCVANMTASRLSMKNMRKTRFFQPNAYISVDFLEKTAEIIELEPHDATNPFALVLEIEGKEPRQISFKKPEVESNNAIRDELFSFYEAIKENKNPVVDIIQGKKALELALNIMKAMSLGKAEL